MNNQVEAIDSIIEDEDMLIESHRESLTCKEYNPDNLINYKLIDKILTELNGKVHTRPFTFDKRGSKFFKFKMKINYHLVHVNVETAKTLIYILIKEYGWKRVDLTYSQTSKDLDLEIYEYFDQDICTDEYYINRYIFSESMDTFRLKYISFEIHYIDKIKRGA